MSQPDSSTHSPQNQNLNHAVDASPIHVNFDLPQPVVTHTRKSKLATVTPFPQHPIDTQAEDPVGAMAQTDLAAAFNDAHLEDGHPTALFDTGLGRWRHWADGPGGRGGRWIVDDGYCLSSMRELAAAMLELYLSRDPDAAKPGPKSDKLKREILSERNLSASLRLAAAFGRARAHDSWDRDPMVIAMDNGQVVRLDRQEVVTASPVSMVSRSLQPGLHLTEQTPESPSWNRFLWESLSAYPEKDRVEVADYLRRWAGYSLTGSTFNESFLFLAGRPGTGKSTYLETLLAAWGSYATTVAGERIASDLPAHRQWIARLVNRRLVVVTELPTKRSVWRTSELNSLISGESIEGNLMRQNSFAFLPVCKIIVSGNTRPAADPGSGIWRRMRLIRFESVPKQVDPHLKQRLKLESDGVLSWALNGWRDVLKAQKKGHNGLAVPKCIERETETYRSDQNDLGEWIEDCLFVEPGGFVAAGDLYQSYTSWATSQGVKYPLGQRALGRHLTSLGYQSKRTMKQRGYIGLSIA